MDRRPFKTHARLAAVATALLACVCVGGEVEDHYRVAAGHYAQRRWETALDEFRSFLSLYPEHPLSVSIPFFQGEALHQLRRYDEAHDRYAHYLSQLDPQQYLVHARFRLGECSTLLGKHQRALEELDRFLELHSHDVRQGHANLFRGQSLLALEQADRAREAYLKSLEQLQETKADLSLTNKCRFGLAKALLVTGEPAQARRFFTFIVGAGGPLADDALAEMIVHDSTDEVAADVARFREKFWSSLHRERVELFEARRLQRLGRHLDAAETLLDVVDETTAADPGAEMLFEAGRSCHLAGDNLRALRCFEQIQLRWPDAENADNAMYASILLADSEDTGARCEAFAQAHPDSPFLPETRELYGEWQIQHGQYEAAAENLRALRCDLQTSPADEVRAAYLLLLALVGCGENAEAAELAATIDCDLLPSALLPGMHSAHGDALMKEGRLVEASAAFAKCLPLTQGAARSRCAAQRAICLAQYRQIEEAMEMLSLMDRGARRDEAARFVAAQAIRVGALAEAELLLGEVGDKKLNSSELASLASAQWEAGHRDQALSRLTQLQQRFADAAETHQLTLRWARIMEREGQGELAEPQFVWLSQNGVGGMQRAGRFLVGRRLEQTGRDEQAVHVLEPLAAETARLATHVKSSDDASAVVDAPRDAVLYHLAWALADLRKMDQARGVFADLAALDEPTPLRTDAVLRAAKLEFKSGQPKLAARRLDLALPDLAGHRLQPDLLLLRGHIAVAERDWSVAIERLEQLMALCDAAAPQQPLSSPSLAEAHFLLGEAYYRTRRFSDSRTQMARSTQILDELRVPGADADADTSPRWQPMLALRSAQLMAQAKQWREAADLATSLLNDFPQFSLRHEAAYLLGRALAARAQFNAARQAYARVLAMPAAKGTVTAAKAQWMIGETYFHQRQYTAAISAYHRVELLHEHEEWQALALTQAAKCHRQIGNEHEASRLLADVQRRFPHSRGARETAKEGQE
ncbi:MAG: tetratricopeptide repeat protein [Planctomycetales bacterium]|nr:tetratricopeptide repeat protein [Planctomycetales bacterium]